MTTVSGSKTCVNGVCPSLTLTEPNQRTPRWPSIPVRQTSRFIAGYLIQMYNTKKTFNNCVNNDILTIVKQYNLHKLSEFLASNPARSFFRRRARLCIVIFWFFFFFLGFFRNSNSWFLTTAISGSPSKDIEPVSPGYAENSTGIKTEIAWIWFIVTKGQPSWSCFLTNVVEIQRGRDSSRATLIFS